MLRLWGETESGGVIYGDDILVASDGAIYLGSKECNVFGCMALATSKAVNMLQKHHWKKPMLLSVGAVIIHRSAVHNVRLYQARDSLVCEPKRSYWTTTTPNGLVIGTYTEHAERMLCDPAMARRRAEEWLSNVLDRIPPSDRIAHLRLPSIRQRMVCAYALFLQSRRNELLEKIDAEYAAA